MDDDEFLRRAEKLAAKRGWTDTTVSRKLFAGNPRKLARMRNAMKGKAARTRKKAEARLAKLEEEGERATLCR